MSKLNVLDVNKNLMTYLANVDRQLSDLQRDSKKQIAEANTLQNVLLERIKERDIKRAEKAAQEKAERDKQEEERPSEAVSVPAEQTGEADTEKAQDVTASETETTVEAASEKADNTPEVPAAETADVPVSEDALQDEKETVKPASVPDEKQIQRMEERRAKANAPENTETRPVRERNRDRNDQRNQDRPARQFDNGERRSQNFRDQKNQNAPDQRRDNRNGRGQFDSKDKDGDERSQNRQQRRTDKPRQNQAGAIASAIPQQQQRNPHDRQKERPVEEKRKKGALKERVVIDDDEYAQGSRKIRKGPKTQKQKPVVTPEPVVIDKAVIYGDTVSIKVFAEKIGKPVAQIIKKLFLLGMMNTNINSEIDFDTASLVAADYDIELEQKIEQTAEDALKAGYEDETDDEENLVIRPPVVTIMGHVDHGKTSILDAIRKTSVQANEAGGITQHIGAYVVNHNNRSITFLDTPGHEAFTSMRARGANVTDIAILVVAANDGVMPQTVEAINHAKAANVPIIVAINKIDIPGSSIDMVKRELTEYGLVAEDWGGDTVMVPVSAKTKEGLDDLLEMILLVADVGEYKANPNRLAKGAIIEAKLDKGRGPVATVLVQNGTLNVADTVVAGTAYGRIRAMTDDKGRNVKKAGPSQPVEVIGFSEVPSAGDTLYVVDEKLSRQVVQERIDKQKELRNKSTSRVTLDDLFSQIEQGNVKDLNIVIKADVQGSVEAVRQSLEKISNDEVRVRVIHGAVGAISEGDVLLASAANAIIIGFNVRPDASVSAIAEREKVDIRTYRIIYNAIDDVTKAINGMLAPEFKEEVQGHAEIRQTFRVSSVGTIAGCYMLDGKMTRNSEIRLLRDNVVIYEGKLNSLKRFKDDVREVTTGYEFGASLENYNDIKEGDVLEAFVMQKVERSV